MVNDMAIAILMRLLHIFSAVAIGGGLLGWKFATRPALDAAAPDRRAALSDAAAAAWRPLAIAGIVGLLISGMYSAATIHGVPPVYHAALGLKILLALHVFAVVILGTKPGNPKRDRLLTGAMWSALAVLLIAVMLRWLPALV
jgi:hypothetical protein